MNESVVAVHNGKTFRIEDDPSAGFYLYVFESGKCTHDYLQDTLELAKTFARDQFGVPKDAWQLGVA